MSRYTSFEHFAAEARSRIEAGLDRWLPASPATPPLLADAMRYSVMAGGKRLRPLLVLAAADAVARHSENDVLPLALPAACAVELIHTYSLIHDDLPAMDDDSLRRGKPTLHVVYSDAIAVLAGDALQAEAFALLAREPVTDNHTIRWRKLRALESIAVAAGAQGMVGGQTIDIQGAGQVAGHPLSLTEPSLRDMHLRKTGALIRASAISGAIMGGGAETAIEAIGRWAHEVGLAFQIVDDILDVEGQADVLGKTAGKDAADDKPTYPALFGLSKSKEMAEECAERAQAALAGEGLDDSWLAGMAAWVLERKN